MAKHKNMPIAVTMGEPAGIGPELIARAWQDLRASKAHNIVYFGSVDALLAADPNLPLEKLDSATQATDLASDTLGAIDIPLAEPAEPGALNPQNGLAVINSIEAATQAAIEGSVAGLVTAPIHKAALYGCGFDAPGHTEYLARLCDLPDQHSVMMLATEGLRVVPVTVHVPLADVARTLTTDKIFHAGMITATDLRDRFDIITPRLAVAGLNPHAGESGTIGMEEATHIMPAIWALRDEGIDVSDPQPADTLFHEEARAAYDAVLCMYHDQALIPLKTLDFWGGVNITLGLPIIRTSPDHGTALSLAGKGVARIDSMVAALKMARKMADTQALKNQALQ